MNLKVFTLVFDAEAQAFDDGELQAFQAEHEVVGLYEHFFVHHGTPHWVARAHQRVRPLGPTFGASTERASRCRRNIGTSTRRCVRGAARRPLGQTKTETPPESRRAEAPVGRCLRGTPPP